MAYAVQNSDNQDHVFPDEGKNSVILLEYLRICPWTLNQFSLTIFFDKRCFIADV